MFALLACQASAIVLIVWISGGFFLVYCGGWILTVLQYLAGSVSLCARFFQGHVRPCAKTQTFFLTFKVVLPPPVFSASFADLQVQTLAIVKTLNLAGRLDASKFHFRELGHKIFI